MSLYKDPNNNFYQINLHPKGYYIMIDNLKDMHPFIIITKNYNNGLKIKFYKQLMPKEEQDFIFKAFYLINKNNWTDLLKV